MIDNNNRNSPPILFPIPSRLKHIPHPPKKLYIRGKFPETEKYLCVVGARKYTDYGVRVCEYLIKELSHYPICIVSGLALGIDTIAHLSALKNKLPTIAFPGSGLNDEVIYPATHVHIAKDIISKGGCLISEYEPDEPTQSWSFPQRNRLVAGICDAVLVIEAKTKSGTMITARLALDYNKTVLTVPGSIFSEYSEGPNSLIRLGATPVRCGADILDALNIKARIPSKQTDRQEIFEMLRETCSEKELLIISKLFEPKRRDELVLLLDMPIHQLNVALSMLELKEIIEEKLGKIYLKIF